MSEPKFATTKEMFDQLEFCHYEAIGGPLELNVAYIQLKQRIAMLESQLAWIPVNERLPEAPNGTQLGVRYLVLYAGYYHDICVFWPHNKTWTRNDEDKTEDITHWRPLPEPQHECRIQEAQNG
jgi:hypothetical protein